MRHVPLWLAALGLSGCSSVVTLTDVDAGMSVVVPLQPNAAANGAEVVPLVVRLADGAGAPLANLRATLSSEHCLVTQPTAPTDASGTLRGSVRCAAPGLQTVGVTIQFNNASAVLQASGQVYFYPAANSSGAVLGGTALLAQAVAFDANGTPDLGYRGTVQFSSSDPLAALPAPQTLGAADHGYRALPQSLILRTEGRQTVTCTDSATGAVLSTQTLQVIPAPATTLLLAVQGNTLVAGASTSVTVSAIDGYGNINSSYAGTVSFASSDTLGVVPAPYTFLPADQGSKTFVGGLSLRTAGQQLLFVEDGTLSGLTNVGVTGAAAAGLQLVIDGNAVAGVAEDVTVQALDIYGNASPSYVGTVRFTSSDPNAIVPADLAVTAADAGSATARRALVLTTAGLSSLQAADTFDASLQNATVDIRTVAAAAQRLTLRLPATSTAGDTLNPIVVAQDAFGNPAPNYAGTIAFSVSDPQGAAPANYTFKSTDAGAHAFVQGLRLLTAQSTTTRVQDLGGLPGAGATTVVTAAGAAVLQVSGNTNTTAGSSIDLTVRALDPFDNVATTFASTVSLSNADPRGSCTPTVQLSHGVGNAAGGASFISSGQWNVAATDPNLTRLNSLPLVVHVSAGPVTTLHLDMPVVLTGNPNTASVGQLLTPTVSAFDSYQNPVANYRGTIHFSSSDANAILPPDYTFSAADAGRVTFSNDLSLITPASNTWVTVADTQNSMSASITGTNVYHRCGYLDGVGSYFYPGLAQTAAMTQDANGYLYSIASVELAAQRYTDWQVYAVHWTGKAWDTSETPPRPATSLIDDGNAVDFVYRVSAAYGADGPATAFEGAGNGGTGIYYAQRVNNVWAGLGGSREAPMAVNGLYPRVLLDNASNPYVFWIDPNNFLRLRSWNGTSWAVVGGNELLPIPTVASNSARASYDVAIDAGNTLYVAWGNSANVFLINWNGSAWSGLGGSASGTGVSNSSGSATLPAVVVTSSGPAVSWSDNGSGYTEIYLKQWNGSAWVPLAGSASAGGVSNEQGSATNYSLAVDHHGRLLPLWAASAGGNCAASNVPVHFRRLDGSNWDSINNSATYTGCSYVVDADEYGSGSSLQMFVDANDVPIVTERAFGNILVCAYY